MKKDGQKSNFNKLLSVDWDFFFPVDETGPDAGLYDWGHQESKYFIDGLIWSERAAGFLRQGKPLPGTSGAEVGFWDRFDFSDDAQLFVADSHSQIMAVGTAQSVLNYDAHHDCGYDPQMVAKNLAEGYVCCDDWLACMITQYGASAESWSQIRSWT